MPHSPQGKEVARLRWTWLPSLRSLITKGKQAWTLIEYDGRGVCIQPSSPMKDPVCFLPDVEAAGYESLAQYKFHAIIAKCGPEAMFNATHKVKYTLTVKLTNCKEYGKATNPEDIPPIIKPKSRMRIRKYDINIRPYFFYFLYFIP